MRANLEELAAAMDAVAKVAPSRELGAALREEIWAAARILETAEVALVARLVLADAEGLRDGRPSTAVWLAETTGMSQQRAGVLLGLARRLRDPALAPLREALLSRGVRVEQARVVERGLRGLRGEDVVVVQQELLALAPRVDLGQLREGAAYVRRLIAARREDGEGHHEDQQDVRSLELHDVQGGMGHADGLVDPELLALLRTTFDHFAAPTGPDDLRTGAQRRHDALKEALTLLFDSGTLGDQAGQRPHLQLVVHAGAGGTIAGQPGHLDQGGTISPATVSRLACDAEVTVTVVEDEPSDGCGPDDGAALFTAEADLTGYDPRLLDAIRRTHLGRRARAGGLLAQVLAWLPPALGGLRRDVLDQGFTTRLATAAQLRALRARDGGCVGCGAHHHRCQAHHVVWWEHGGPTDLANLVLVCFRHHQLIHEGKVRVITVDGRFALEVVEGPGRRRARAA